MTFKQRYYIFVIGVAFVFVSHSVCSQTVRPISTAEMIELIDSVSVLLNENYVFPEVAQKIEKHLKSQEALNEFKSITTKSEFAEKLTSEMQKISKDKHMRCFFRSGNVNTNRPKNRLNFDSDYENLSNEKHLGFIRAGMLENNIGVLDIYNFPGSDYAKKSVDEAMKIVTSSSVIIIDLRRNGGGSPDCIRYICSYFFKKPTHINSIYWRSTNQTVDYITFENVNGKKMADIPVYVLTSSFTFSGGEEFAYNFQTQKRGILIGETTGGGANPGDIFKLNDDFEVFIPTGRAINPITKTNWEGVGVKPDIEVNAVNAFEMALSQIKKLNKINEDK
jgi:retinol-binding protein 3